MIYKFKSKAAGDVIMMGETGDLVLRAAGREPAPKGIIEAPALAAAVAAVERAITAEEAERADAERRAEAEGSKLPPAGLMLRQRAWPLLEMMKRAQADDVPVVWGV